MITMLELATVDNSGRPASDGYHSRKLHPAGVEMGNGRSIRLRRQS